MWNRLGSKGEISCRQVEARLMAYLKDGLSPVQAQKVRQHLAICDVCTRSLRETQILDAELRVQAARHQPVLSSEASARIQDTVYKRMRRGLIMQRAVRFAGIAAALVVLVTLMVGAASLWQRMRPAGEELGKREETVPVGSKTASASTPPQIISQEDERINILLLGIDRRGGSGWGYRTDTIILVTLDTNRKTAGLLSIPRDLQVPIPDFGEDRINTVNVYGYMQHYPGDGPDLLKQTIEANFAIPVDYYIVADFDGFREIVDALGGVELDVPRELHDTQYPDPKPDDPHAYKTVHFEPGWQHMDGERALEYARSRMSTSDADRAWRQQQILLAIREAVLDQNLIQEVPKLATTLKDSIETDMTLEEMLELARLVLAIDADNLTQVVLEEPLVYSHRRENGAAVLLPRWDLINAVVAELMGASVGAQPTSTPSNP
jgi:LCP family protein required for cell wall assembly